MSSKQEFVDGLKGAIAFFEAAPSDMKKPVCSRWNIFADTPDDFNRIKAIMGAVDRPDSDPYKAARLDFGGGVVLDIVIRLADYYDIKMTEKTS